MNGRNHERKTRATMQFASWLRKFHPEMYAAVMERMGGREAPPAGALNQLAESWNMLGQIDPFGGIGVATTTTTTVDGTAWYSDILAFAKEAVPAYLAYDAQKDLMSLNLERARQGQEPIDPGLVAAQIRVVHDLPPETRGILDSFKTGGNILLWAALGLGAFFVVRMLR